MYKRQTIYYALNLSMGENREKNLGKIKTVKENNFIICENTCKSQFKDKIEITSSVPIKSYTNSKTEFFDNNLIPIGINKEKLEIEGCLLYTSRCV